MRWKIGCFFGKDQIAFLLHLSNHVTNLFSTVHHIQTALIRILGRNQQKAVLTFKSMSYAFVNKQHQWLFLYTRMLELPKITRRKCGTNSRLPGLTNRQLAPIVITPSTANLFTRPKNLFWFKKFAQLQTESRGLNRKCLLLIKTFLFLEPVQLPRKLI